MGVSPLGKDNTWEINLAARAAWMSFLGDLTQSDIARRLGLSSARVHRLILMAKEMGLVRVSIEGRPTECLEMEAELIQRYGLKSCTISPYLREQQAPEEYAIASVGQAAGQLLGQHLLLPATKSICVGPGRTMMAAITSMPRVPRPDMKIYAGIGSLAADLSSNPFDVVSMFAERTEGRAFVLPLPSFVSTIAQAAIYLDQAPIRETIASAETSELVVAGIGTLDSQSHLGAAGLLSARELEAVRMAGAAAEFMGTFLDPEGQVVDPAVTPRNMGIDIKRLKGARVFALAAHRIKRTAVLAVLRSSTLSDLVIDESLASGLLEA